MLILRSLYRTRNDKKGVDCNCCLCRNDSWQASIDADEFETECCLSFSGDYVMDSVKDVFNKPTEVEFKFKTNRTIWKSLQRHVKKRGLRTEKRTKDKKCT